MSSNGVQIDLGRWGKENGLQQTSDIIAKKGQGTDYLLGGERGPRGKGRGLPLENNKVARSYTIGNPI